MMDTRPLLGVDVAEVEEAVEAVRDGGLRIGVEVEEWAGGGRERVGVDIWATRGVGGGGEERRGPSSRDASVFEPSSAGLTVVTFSENSGWAVVTDAEIYVERLIGSGKTTKADGRGSRVRSAVARVNDLLCFVSIPLDAIERMVRSSDKRKVSSLPDLPLMQLDIDHLLSCVGL